MAYHEIAIFTDEQAAKDYEAQKKVPAAGRTNVTRRMVTGLIVQDFTVKPVNLLYDGEDGKAYYLVESDGD
ncbi:MAG: hypothetical protein EBS05_08535 [Proteobacteria bacterium]|nr:hypothetical protein [Pseudomonadota bacterium]